MGHGKAEGQMKVTCTHGNPGKKHNFKAVLVPTTLWTLDVETRPFFGGFP